MKRLQKSQAAQIETLSSRIKDLESANATLLADNVMLLNAHSRSFHDAKRFQEELETLKNASLLMAFSYPIQRKAEPDTEFSAKRLDQKNLDKSSDSAADISDIIGNVAEIP